MGLNGLPPDEQFADAKREEVEVKDISVVFESILSKTNRLDVVVKIDCEGEEFNLISRLSETGLLSKIKALMIEWHYRSPQELEVYLERSGFQTFSLTDSGFNSGMIYACS
jgi:hypothetical protein